CRDHDLLQPARLVWGAVPVVSGVAVACAQAWPKPEAFGARSALVARRARVEARSMKFPYEFKAGASLGRLSISRRSSIGNALGDKGNVTLLREIGKFSL